MIVSPVSSWSFQPRAGLADRAARLQPAGHRRAEMGAPGPGSLFVLGSAIT